MGDRTTKNHDADLDGWRKNADKLGKEFEKVKTGVKESLKEDSHDPLMNAVKGAADASPYWFSHAALIGLGLAAVVIVALVVALVI